MVKKCLALVGTMKIKISINWLKINIKRSYGINSIKLAKSNTFFKPNVGENVDCHKFCTLLIEIQIGAHTWVYNLVS